MIHREQPVLWGAEVFSGQGPREVRTSLQLSDRPLVDHVMFETGDFHALHQICFAIHLRVVTPPPQVKQC